jgi:hypothetical protein
MKRHHRRDFLADIGRGMLLASVGPVVAQDLGLASAALADEGTDRLNFGALEPLVGLMQDTPADRLLPALVERVKGGADLGRLVAAAALANARTFGGQDYEGYHAFMALSPSYHMARELKGPSQALPVLKVLYRNTNHIQQMGGHAHEKLHPMDGSTSTLSNGQNVGEALREATRRHDIAGAERIFAGLGGRPLDEIYHDLQYIVQDDINVHRVVLAWRSWALLDLTGKEYAQTMLRQSVRFCCQEEPRNHQVPLREVLPNLMETKGLLSGTPAPRDADDAWIEKLSHVVYSAPRKEAAEAVAMALAEGFSPEAVGEAISLAANQLVLHDVGRKKAEAGKPVGSIHGASVGVHASDSANAWRNIARVSDRRNTVASLIVGAFHTAGQTGGLYAKPYPLAEHREKVANVAPDALLSEGETAIKAKDQARACALVHRYGELDRPARPVFDMLLKYAISEDGALHAEKYYRTVTEEFDVARPAFKWNHLAGLARVTASEYGFPAPGVAEAKGLLGV